MHISYDNAKCHWRWRYKTLIIIKNIYLKYLADIFHFTCYNGSYDYEKLHPWTSRMCHVTSVPYLEQLLQLRYHANFKRKLCTK